MNPTELQVSAPLHLKLVPATIIQDPNYRCGHYLQLVQLNLYTSHHLFLQVLGNTSTQGFVWGQLSSQG